MLVTTVERLYISFMVPFDIENSMKDIDIPAWIQAITGTAAAVGLLLTFKYQFKATKKQVELNEQQQRINQILLIKSAKDIQPLFFIHGLPEINFQQNVAILLKDALAKNVKITDLLNNNVTRTWEKGIPGEFSYDVSVSYHIANGIDKTEVFKIEFEDEIGIKYVQILNANMASVTITPPIPL